MGSIIKLLCNGFQGKSFGSTLFLYVAALAITGVASLIIGIKLGADTAFHLTPMLAASSLGLQYAISRLSKFRPPRKEVGKPPTIASALEMQRRRATTHFYTFLALALAICSLAGSMILPMISNSFSFRRFPASVLLATLTVSFLKQAMRSLQYRRELENKIFRWTILKNHTDSIDKRELLLLLEHSPTAEFKSLVGRADIDEHLKHLAEETTEKKLHEAKQLQLDMHYPKDKLARLEVLEDYRESIDKRDFLMLLEYGSTTQLSSLTDRVDTQERLRQLAEETAERRMKEVLPAPFAA